MEPATLVYPVSALTNRARWPGHILRGATGSPGPWGSVDLWRGCVSSVTVHVKTVQGPHGSGRQGWDQPSRRTLLWGGGRTELDPSGGCQQVEGSGERSGPALQAELALAAQAGWPLSRTVRRRLWRGVLQGCLGRRPGEQWC